MSSVHEHYMKMAIQEAVKALEKGDVPVGAVVVYENRVIGRAHNQMELLHDPTAHAEMIALTQASETVSQGQERHRGSLEGATIYATLEPCPMCAGAIVWTKCKNLVYGAKDPKAGACGSLYNIVSDDRLNHRVNVISGIMESDARTLLQEFFKALRRDRR
ncbi:MAG: nucleoside deaminase [Candidatus Omnitrophica bacterium]|nr:nucleoside deaminase [Candidatus Omnitrophota bacterium]